MNVRTPIILVLAAVMLADCGRRGSLEPPAAAAAEQSIVRALPSDGISPLDPGSEALGGKAAPEPPPARERRFLLDFLL